MKKKILVVTGTRAEYGLLKSTLAEIRRSQFLDLRLLVTGMHTVKRFGLTSRTILADGLPIHATVPIGEHDDMVTALAKELKGIQAYCQKYRPDLMLVLGDRDEPFASVIVAGHLNIPVAHIHGGDVSGFVVDSYIRDAITKFSHLHFAISKQSADRLLSLGEERWRIFQVGSPGVDSLRGLEYLSRAQVAKNLKLKLEKPWFVLLQHPVALDHVPVQVQIDSTVKALSGWDAEIIAIYPNTDTGNEDVIRALRKFARDPRVKLAKNLPRTAYASLLKESSLLIGNSSSGIIEAGYFHLPVINIGNRQLNRECGENVIHVGYSASAVRKAIALATSAKFKQKCRTAKNPYGAGKTGEKIVRLLERNIKNPKLLYKDWLYAD